MPTRCCRISRYCYVIGSRNKLPLPRTINNLIMGTTHGLRNPLQMFYRNLSYTIINMFFSSNVLGNTCIENHDLGNRAKLKTVPSIRLPDPLAGVAAFTAKLVCRKNKRLGASKSRRRVASPREHVVVSALWDDTNPPLVFHQF